MACFKAMTNTLDALGPHNSNVTSQIGQGIVQKICPGPPGTILTVTDGVNVRSVAVDENLSKQNPPIEFSTVNMIVDILYNVKYDFIATLEKMENSRVCGRVYINWDKMCVDQRMSVRIRNHSLNAITTRFEMIEMTIGENPQLLTHCAMTGHLLISYPNKISIFLPISTSLPISRYPFLDFHELFSITITPIPTAITLIENIVIIMTKLNLHIFSISKGSTQKWKDEWMYVTHDYDLAVRKRNYICHDQDIESVDHFFVPMLSTVPHSFIDDESYNDFIDFEPSTRGLLFDDHEAKRVKLITSLRLVSSNPKTVLKFMSARPYYWLCRETNIDWYIPEKDAQYMSTKANRLANCMIVLTTETTGFLFNIKMDRSKPFVYRPEKIYRFGSIVRQVVLNEVMLHILTDTGILTYAAPNNMCPNQLSDTHLNTQVGYQNFKNINKLCLINETLLAWIYIDDFKQQTMLCSIKLPNIIQLVQDSNLIIENDFKQNKCTFEKYKSISLNIYDAAWTAAQFCSCFQVRNQLVASMLFENLTWIVINLNLKHEKNINYAELWSYLQEANFTFVDVFIRFAYIRPIIPTVIRLLLHIFINIKHDISTITRLGRQFEKRLSSVPIFNNRSNVTMATELSLWVEAVGEQQWENDEYIVLSEIIVWIYTWEISLKPFTYILPRYAKFCDLYKVVKKSKLLLITPMPNNEYYGFSEFARCGLFAYKAGEVENYEHAITYPAEIAHLFCEIAFSDTNNILNTSHRLVTMMREFAYGNNNSDIGNFVHSMWQEYENEFIMRYIQVSSTDEEKHFLSLIRMNAGYLDKRERLTATVGRKCPFIQNRLKKIRKFQMTVQLLCETHKKLKEISDNQFSEINLNAVNELVSPDMAIVFRSKRFGFLNDVTPFGSEIEHEQGFSLTKYVTIALMRIEALLCSGHLDMNGITAVLDLISTYPHIVGADRMLLCLMTFDEAANYLIRLEKFSIACNVAKLYFTNEHEWISLLRNIDRYLACKSDEQNLYDDLEATKKELLCYISDDLSLEQVREIVCGLTSLTFEEMTFNANNPYEMCYVRANENHRLLRLNEMSLQTSLRAADDTQNKK